MSTLTAFDYIAERSEATPGLWNTPFSILSANIRAASESTDFLSSALTFSVTSGIEVGGGGHFQYLSVGSTPPSEVTTAAITVAVNSATSDYLYLNDSSALKSNYVIGSRAGGTADGLNIWDASGDTMIVSFSKQSIRFYQNVVGPVFDVGGALADTYNAATFGTGDQSVESRIQAAISQATIDGVSRVYVPANMYPYSAGSVVFSSAVQMVREGGSWGVNDVRAYGAHGDNAADDSKAITAAESGLTRGGVIYFPAGTYRCSYLTASNSSTIWMGERAAVLRKRANGPILTISARSVTVTGLAFDGQASAGFNNRCILLSAATGSIVEQCQIFDAFSYGIELQNSPRCIVRANVLSGNSDIAIFGQQGNLDAVIDSNDVTTPAFAPAHAIALHSTTAGLSVSGARIVNNRCRSSASLAFCIEVGDFGGDRPTDIVIANNVCSSDGSLVGGISVAGADYVTVQGNTIHGNSGHSFTVAGIELASATRCSVVGNTVISVGGNMATGIMVDQSSDNVVGNNTIEGIAPGGAGVFLTSSIATFVNNNVVSGNVIRMGSNASNGMGIRLQSNHASAQVSDNLFIGNRIVGAHTPGSRGFNISQDAGALRTPTLVGNVISGVSTAVNAGVAIWVVGSTTTNVTSSYGGAGPFNGLDPQYGFINYPLLTFNTVSMLFAGGDATAPTMAFILENGLGWYRSGASTMALSRGTLLVNGPVWGSGLSIGGTGTLIPAISSTSSKVAAFIVQGSASSFTIVTWAAVKAGDQILVTIQPDTAVSSLSSGIVLHSHCTQNGQVELRLSNASTLEQRQSSKTYFFTRITPF